MVLVDYPKPEVMPALVKSVDATQLGTQDFGGYKPLCGTVVYTLTDAAPRLTLDLVVAIDTALWDGFDGSAIADPISVKVLHGATEDASVEAHGTITGTSPLTPQIAASIVKATPAKTSQQNSFPLGCLRVFTGRAMYCKELSMVVALPYNTATKTYARFDKLRYDPYGDPAGNALDPSINKSCTVTSTVDDANHTVTITWKNIYVSCANEFVTPLFYWDESDGAAPSDGDPVVWKMESSPATDLLVPLADAATDTRSMYITAIFESGAEALFKNKNNYVSDSFDVYSVLAGSQISLSWSSPAQTNRFAIAPDTTYALGKIFLRHEGAIASPEKIVTFTYANNDLFHVTAQAIPATSGNKVKVSYKARKADGTDEVTGSYTATAADDRVVFTAALAGIGDDYFFTEIRAEVGSYEPYFGRLRSEWVNSNGQDVTFVTFGKLTSAQTFPTGKRVATLSVEDANPTAGTANPEPISVSFKALADPQCSGLGFTRLQNADGSEVPALSSNVLIAGDTIRFSGLVSSGAQRNDNLVVTVDDTEIYLRLPKAISPSNLSVSRIVGSTVDILLRGDGFETTRREMGTPTTTDLVRDVDYVVEGPVSLGDHWNVWKISFNNRAGQVGWFTESLGQIQLKVTFDMVLADASESLLVNLRECLFVKSASLKGINESISLTNRFSLIDTYGIVEAFSESPLASATALAASGEGARLGTFSSTNTGIMFVVEAARGGNQPTVSVGTNGGTAPTGMEPLLLVDENGEVTLPPAPVKAGRTFEGWVASDGKVYQPGEKLKVGNENITLAAKWSDEPAPVPDASRPFEFTVNELGVNYGGRAADPNADAEGTVPEGIAWRADQAAQGLDPGTEGLPGEGSYVADGPGAGDGAGSPGADGDGPGAGGGIGPDASTGGPGAGGSGSGSGATTVRNYTPLIQTGDSLPVILFLCTGGLALVAMAVAWFVQGRRKQEGE